jgi:acylphosphatase
MERISAHLFISGRVQGVCYRLYAEKEALEKRLTGWVRNLPDGRVEVLLEGEKQAVEEMIAWCRQGPEAAKVTDVEVSFEPYHGNFKDFRTV